MVKQDKWWEWEIHSQSKSWDEGLHKLLPYRHFIFNMVRRDLILNYKQTILGPAWILFQPVLTLIIYLFVFGKIIGVPIGNLPPVLFYFSGIVLWNFFNDSFTGTSRTFRDNAHLFSKVYFPRIIMPLASISTQFVRLAIQLLLLLVLFLYFIFFQGFPVKYNLSVLFFPLSVFLVGLLSLSMGLFFSVITAKYRDITNVVDICMRLLIFVTPVFYPLSSVRQDIRWIVNLNPLTPLFELFRSSLFGTGTIYPVQLLYSMSFILVSFFVSVWLFNHKASSLIDVV